MLGGGGAGGEGGDGGGVGGTVPVCALLTLSCEVLSLSPEEFVTVIVTLYCVFAFSCVITGCGWPGAERHATLPVNLPVGLKLYH